MGAHIQLEGTNKETISDANGNFQLTDVNPGTYKMRIKFVGFNDYETDVKVVASRGVTTLSKVEYLAFGQIEHTLNEVNIFGIDQQRIGSCRPVVRKERQ